jgi:hypothetical protein
MQREAVFFALLMVVLGTGKVARADSYVAGNRSFIPTMLTDDPFVADEISTTVTRIRNLPSNGDPAVNETDIGWEIAKRITPDLGVEIEQGYGILAPTGLRRVYGFDNLEAALKYQFYVNPAHELLLSAGIEREFGGTGATRIADTTSATAPMLYVGKGMGDLPESLGWLRPFAITGTLDYEIPDRHDPTSPQMVEAGLALEYSLRYLEGNVRYLALPEWLDRLTPLVEIDYATPASRAAGVSPVGYVAPGLVYSGNSFDIGAEVLIPITRATGTNVGVMTMLHFRLEDLFPTTIGRPLWAGIGRSSP